MATVTAGNSYSQSVSADQTIAISVSHNSSGRIRFTPINTEGLPVDAGSGIGFGPLAMSKTFGPWGQAGTVTIFCDVGTVTYTINPPTFYDNPVLSGGTANGVVYLDANKVATSGSALQFDGNNLGLGTPSPWSGVKAFDAGTTGCFYGSGGDLGVVSNAYYNGANWIYKTGTVGTPLYASRYQAVVGTGVQAWFTAPAGVAGNAITFTQAMTLDASGNLVVGGTSAVISGAGRGNVTINGASTAIMALSVGGAAKGSMYHTGTDVEIINYHSGGELAFYVNGAYRTRITSGGDFLVGKNALSQTTVGFQVEPTGVVSDALAASANTTTTLNIYSTGASAYRFYVGLGGTVYATNTTISAISDQRLKENIRDLDVGLNAVLALKPRKFDWKAGKGKDKKDDRGFIAQEFEQVFPDLIDTWKDPAPEGEEPYKSVRADLIPVLVKAIQEQQAMIDELKAEVAALKGA